MTINIERELLEQAQKYLNAGCAIWSTSSWHKAIRAELAKPVQKKPISLIDVEALIEIVTDIRQHINHGVASEKFEALQRPGYGTGIYTHISNQLNKIMAILAAPATAPEQPTKLDPTGSELHSKQADQAEVTSQGQVSATTPDVKAMANRLMGWPLPKDFYPDGGISFDGRKDDEWNKNKQWPIGTNLLTVDQAIAMFKYVLSQEGGAS